ncbi:MAG: threonine synthase [Candidatus Aureabacteria bacterium]|nr:threonine synthase [Candidatus Auribacterota bacterium]
MHHVLGLKCTGCGREFEARGMRYVCDRCGKNLDVVYDYAAIRKRLTRETLAANTDFSVWRYWDLYPLEDHSTIMPLAIGWSPLYRAEALASRLGIKTLFLKDDGRNPSASFKDRASSVAIAKALDLGFNKICGASTGNAASSTACLCASIGLSPIIFVPETAPKAKIAQLLIFGAKVFAVKGSYDDAFDLCLEAAEEYGWYNRNTGYNPYTREGKKSCSFEICEQLNWEVPDLVFVPVGDGNIISGIWKGFRDLQGVGLIHSMPKLVAVQSEKSSAVADAVNGDGVIRPVKATTIADSISVDLPRDGDMAVRAVRESEGMAVTVRDEEILDTIPLLARTCGIFAEPAGATSVAGLKKLIAKGDLSGSERIVCLITGNGLKDVDTAMKIAGRTISIEPDLDSLKKAIGGAGIE